MKTQMWRRIMGVMFTVGAFVASAGHQWFTDVEVPGDNFSLEGALELFKKSSSPEEFEKLLNMPESKVNNLDLNGDNRIDYIKVIDRYDGHVHAFILQAVISDRELQDIAVIELEMRRDGEATLQIVGDADIYGVETIIEPTTEVKVYAGTATRQNVVNVWSWPVVQYVYDPYYSVWISPWGWRSLPVWYYPWRPIDYVVYRPYWDPYRPYYSSCNYHRNVYAWRIYRPVRTTSVIVYNRHHDNVVRARNTRGRDYDRDGFYRGEDGDRNRRQDTRVRSYDNSRDIPTNNDRNSFPGGRSTDSQRKTHQGDRSQFDRYTSQQPDRERVNTTRNAAPRIESWESKSRSTQQSESRPRVEVSRSTTRSDSHPSNVSPRPRTSESNTRSHVGVASPTPRSESKPRISSPASGHRSDHSSSGSSSQSSGSKKRGRD